MAWPLVCDGCQFDTEIWFADSALRTVRILDSELPALDGTRMRLERHLGPGWLQGRGHGRLQQAKVDGQLRLRGSVREAGAGAVAVLARGCQLTARRTAPGMEARGLVSFEGAKVTGTLDLAGARVSCPGERALDLNYATIGGTLWCPAWRRWRDPGQQLPGRRGLVMRGARLDNPGGTAFFAGGLEVAGGAFFSQGFSAQRGSPLIGRGLAANLSPTAAASTTRAAPRSAWSARASALNGPTVSCRGQLAWPEQTSAATRTSQARVWKPATGHPP